MTVDEAIMLKCLPIVLFQYAQDLSNYAVKVLDYSLIFSDSLTIATPIIVYENNYTKECDVS